MSRSRHSDLVACETLERLRWPTSAACPRCGAVDVYQMQSRSGGREVPMRWRCRRCLRQFSVRTGTPLEGTGIALEAWLRAMLAVGGSGCGLSHREVQRVTGLTYKSALALNARLTEALPAFGWQSVRPPVYWTSPGNQKCRACGRQFVNSNNDACPECRWSGDQAQRSEQMTAERREWDHPSKEETWWKIAEAKLREVRRANRCRSRPGVATSEPDRTSRA